MGEEGKGNNKYFMLKGLQCWIKVSFLRFYQFFFFQLVKRTDAVEEEGRLVLPAVNPEDAGFLWIC